MSAGAKDRIDADLLRRRLVDRAEGLFTQVWGAPQNPKAAIWRPKRADHRDDPRRMRMRGAERGLWYDSREGRGGDLFDFAAMGLCGLAAAREDFRRVLLAVSDWLGEALPPSRRHPAKENVTSPPADETALVDEALALLTGALEPLSGPALRYWVMARGLDMPPGSLIQRLRAGSLALRPPHPKLPFAEREAVVVLGRDGPGRIRAAQRIILAPDGADRDRALPKFSLGPVGLYPPVFPPRAGAPPGWPLILAEGPESAAAVWSATGARVAVCCGSVAGFVRTMRRGEAALIAADADPPGSPATTALAKAVDDAHERGVRLALWPVDALREGEDAADLILQPDGKRRIAALIERALATLEEGRRVRKSPASR